MTVFCARGGAIDGDGAIFCCVEETITAVVDGNRDGGRHTVNHQSGISAEGSSCAWFSEGEDGVIPCSIGDAAAVEFKCR